MLLRRITQHVKNQNWFAVLLDFLIVVVGVFIGIQVANWNDGRAERNQASDLVMRMVAETSASSKELEEYTIVHQEISRKASLLAVSLKNAEDCLAMDTELVLLLVSFADFPPPRFSLPNAEQALTTGSLALLKSSAVKLSIQTITDEMAFIERQWQRYVSVKQDAYQVATRLAGVALTGDGELLGQVLGEYDLSSFELLTPEKLCGNTEIFGLFSTVATTQKVYVEYLGQVGQTLESHLAILMSEIAP